MKRLNSAFFNTSLSYLTIYIVSSVNLIPYTFVSCPEYQHLFALLECLAWLVYHLVCIISFFELNKRMHEDFYSKAFFRKYFNWCVWFLNVYFGLSRRTVGSRFHLAPPAESLKKRRLSAFPKRWILTVPEEGMAQRTKLLEEYLQSIVDCKPLRYLEGVVSYLHKLFSRPLTAPF